MNDIITPLKPSLSWSDMFMLQELGVELKEICSKANSLSDNGHINLLFSGKDEHRKVAAQAISLGLEIPLYQIDTKKLIEHYIGESRKDLDTLFEQVENQKAVLFFDDADALFGKSENTYQSNGKYANQEISHLLQTIDAHSGVTIIACDQRPTFTTESYQKFEYIFEFAA